MTCEDPKSPKTSESATQQTPLATVGVKMQQAYDLHLNVDIVGSRTIPGISILGCQPRQGAQRIDKDPLDLPEETRQWLLEANSMVVAWLARDEKNQQTFLLDPIAALEMAGVKMERAHLKAITRMRENIGATQAVVPGLQLRSVKTQVREKGQVKSVDTGSSTWVPPQPKQDKDDCGCDKKGSE